MILLLALLVASISIGSSVKLVKESPQITSSTLLSGASKLNVNSSFLDTLGSAQIFERAGTESQTIGDMGGEEMVERQTFGDMGGEENVERQEVQGNEMQDGASEVFSELAPSTIVYFGETSIPLSSYQNTLGKYLWIESYGGLSQYASVPQFSGLYLMAYTSSSGPGEFLEMYPSASSQGIYRKTSFYFNSGYNRIPYRADVAGTHYLLFSMKDQSSNAVIINVVSGMSPSSSIVLGTNPGTDMQY